MGHRGGNRAGGLGGWLKGGGVGEEGRGAGEGAPRRAGCFMQPPPLPPVES